MRDLQAIQAEADKVDAMLADPKLIPMYQFTALEAYRDALQWALGNYAATPTSFWED